MIWCIHVLITLMQNHKLCSAAAPAESASTLLVSVFLPDVEPAAGTWSHSQTRASDRSNTCQVTRCDSHLVRLFIPKVLRRLRSRLWGGLSSLSHQTRKSISLWSSVLLWTLVSLPDSCNQAALFCSISTRDSSLMKRLTWNGWLNFRGKRCSWCRKSITMLWVLCGPCSWKAQGVW